MNGEIPDRASFAVVSRWLARSAVPGTLDASSSYWIPEDPARLGVESAHIALLGGGLQVRVCEGKMQQTCTETAG